jgi:nucleoredoxin
MNFRTRFSCLILTLYAGAGLPAAELPAGLLAHPELWPATVTLSAATKATVLKNGKPAGAMLLGAGKTLVVSGLTNEGVSGRVGEAQVRVPVEKTDLLSQVGRAHPEYATGLQQEAARRAAPVQQALQDLAGPAASAAPAAPGRATTPPAWAAEATAMQRLFAGRLVRLEGQDTKPVDAAKLAGVKYYALYFSAAWCGPCRAFTPELVKAYAELKQAHPEFELVFVSADRSAAEMLGYMREDRMPWPAVKYDLREPQVLGYSGPGIPCLVLVDAQGKVLADTFRGADYLGPQQALAATRRILKGG